MKVILLAVYIAIPQIAWADELTSYPPKGYSLVKGILQHGSTNPPNFTYQIGEILFGSADLKDRYFMARFADIPTTDDTEIKLTDFSIPKRGEATFHWIALGRGPDGPLDRDVRMGGIQIGEVNADNPTPKFKPAYMRHFSLTFFNDEHKLGKVVPIPRKFPMTGELTPYFQEQVENRRKLGKDPYSKDYPKQPYYVIPPSKKETDEWMSALKEFCNTQDVDQREKLLLKYEKSKCVPLVEWAQFVIKEYGWNPPMPEVEVKKK